MKKNTILIVGSSKIDYIHSLKTDSVTQGYRLICAFRRPTMQLAKKYLELFDTVYFISNPKEMQTFIVSEKNQIAAITNTQERDSGFYIEILQAIDFITKETAQNYYDLTNKQAFKQKLQDAGHADMVPASKEVTATIPPDIYPSIIKPVGLAGSAFVTLVENESQYISLYSSINEEVAEQSQTIYGRPAKIIAEKYVSGPQYSLNIYVHSDGTFTTCPIIRVIPAHELGIKDFYSAIQYTESIPDDLIQSLNEKIACIIKIFNIKNTAAHFDVVLHNYNWVFLEAGLRIGGLRQKIFALTSNSNHFINDIKNRLGYRIVAPRVTSTRVAIVQIATTHSGLLKSFTVPNLKLTECNFTLDKKPQIGTVVKPVSEGGVELLRYFISHTSETELLKEAKNLYRKTIISVLP